MAKKKPQQPPKTAEELLARYAEGERDFIGANLSGANLSGANLSGAELRNAKLSKARLSGADRADSQVGP